MSGLRLGALGEGVDFGAKKLVIGCNPSRVAQMVVVATFLYRGPKTLIQSLSDKLDGGLVVEVGSRSVCWLVIASWYVGGRWGERLVISTISLSSCSRVFACFS